jgi:hypothetical protein
MNTWIISGIILLIGFFICLFLILRNKRLVRKKHIQDYEAARNKLTPEIKKSQEKKEEIESYSGGGFSLGRIISAFVTIFVGVSLIGPISEQVKLAANSTSIATNISTVAETNTILNLVPVFFALAILVIGLITAINSLKSTDLL